MLLSHWIIVSSWLLTSHLSLGDAESPLFHKQSFVVTLTDKNFEHETQASTGGTTGSWMVWFHRSLDDTKFGGTVPEPDFWTERNIVLGSIDVNYNHRTRSRFNISTVPAFRFLHKGKYYRLEDLGKDVPWESVQQFCTENYETTEAYDIPLPTTFRDDVVWFLNRAAEDFGGAYIKAMSLFIASLCFLGILDQIFIQMPKKKAKLLKQMKQFQKVQKNSEKKEQKRTVKKGQKNSDKKGQNNSSKQVQFPDEKKKKQKQKKN